MRAKTAGILLGGAITATAAYLFLASIQTQSLPAAQPPALAIASEANLRQTNDVRVYQAVKDAVVNITSSRTMTQRVSTGNEIFDRMLPPDQLPTRQVQAQSLGSGFVIHPSGYIITNEHVVEEGTDVEVVFSNGDKLPAQVIATDNEHDLAVLKVEPKKPLQAMALGSSEDLMIGEPVYAIGNPFGYAGTMTRGIVSAVNRTLDVSQDKSYKGLIQTDASINPGNSGGPLLNAYGQVIGINTAIRADAHGIGFAISVSNMRDLLPAFLNPEALNKAQVGFTVEEKRTSSGPAAITASVIVKQVQSGSDAAKAGLKTGDAITRVNGTRIVNVVDALVAMGTAKAGDTLTLAVDSSGKSHDVKVPVTKAPLPPAVDLMLTKMGVTGETVTPTLAAKYKLLLRQGVYISQVKVDSPAAKAGIEAGDVLVQLGRYYVQSADDVAALLKTVKEQVDVPIRVVRNNSVGRGVITLH